MQMEICHAVTWRSSNVVLETLSPLETASKHILKVSVQSYGLTVSVTAWSQNVDVLTHS